MDCPHCEANDTARCVVIYAQGTYSGTSSANASSYLPGYGIDQVTAYSRTSGSTAIAQIVAPPEKPSFKEMVGLVVVAVVLLSIPVYFALKWIATLLGVRADTIEAFPPFIVISLGIMLLPVGLFCFVAARTKYKSDLTTWGATWICLRCGHRWIPGLDTPAS